MSSFVHIWSLAESAAQENLRVGNETPTSENKEGKEEADFLVSGITVQRQGKRDSIVTVSHRI